MCPDTTPPILSKILSSFFGAGGGTGVAYFPLSDSPIFDNSLSAPDFSGTGAGAGATAGAWYAPPSASPILCSRFSSFFGAGAGAATGAGAAAALPTNDSPILARSLSALDCSWTGVATATGAGAGAGCDPLSASPILLKIDPCAGAGAGAGAGATCGALCAVSFLSSRARLWRFFRRSMVRILVIIDNRLIRETEYK